MHDNKVKRILWLTGFILSFLGSIIISIIIITFVFTEANNVYYDQEFNHAEQIVKFTHECIIENCGNSTTISSFLNCYQSPSILLCKDSKVKNWKIEHKIPEYKEKLSRLWKLEDMWEYEIKIARSHKTTVRNMYASLGICIGTFIICLLISYYGENS